jgi:uncharacterized protein (TIGR02246 family)
VIALVLRWALLAVPAPEAVPASPNAGALSPDKEAAMSVARDEEAIRRVLAAFTEAVSRGDTEAVLDMITDDAVFWTANYPAIRGKEQLRAAYAGLAAYRVQQEFEIEELQVCGEWAFVRGYENFTLEPKDGQGQRLEIKKRRAISILRRQPDGAWKTARGMTNETPVPGAD